MSDMVQLKGVFRDIPVCRVWLVSMEWSDVLCRHFRETVSKGIGRFTCRSREMAKQSVEKSRAERDRHTIQRDSEFRSRQCGTNSTETKRRVTSHGVRFRRVGGVEWVRGDDGLRCRWHCTRVAIWVSLCSVSRSDGSNVVSHWSGESVSFPLFFFLREHVVGGMFNVLGISRFFGSNII